MKYFTIAIVFSIILAASLVYEIHCMHQDMKSLEIRINQNQIMASVKYAENNIIPVIGIPHKTRSVRQKVKFKKRRKSR